MLSVDLLKSITEYIDTFYEDPISTVMESSIEYSYKPKFSHDIVVQLDNKESDCGIDYFISGSESDDYSEPHINKRILNNDLTFVLDESFSEMLVRLIDERDLRDSYVYQKAGLTRQHFNKIKNNPKYRTSKKTAIALGLALELDMDSMNDLLLKAGFALSNSSKFDLIIKYCLEKKIYDVMTINQILYSFDQEIL